jgi:hypothetical protein
MDMTSTVGVLLDEIPAGPLREQAAAEALAQLAAFWNSRNLKKFGALREIDSSAS